MWWILFSVFVAPVLFLFLLVAVGALIPMRVGVSVQGQAQSAKEWGGRATFGVRFFGGLIGLGFRAEGEASTRTHLAGGVLFWRWFFPLKSLDSIFARAPEVREVLSAPASATREPGVALVQPPPEKGPATRTRVEEDLETGGPADWTRLFEDSDLGDFPIDWQRTSRPETTTAGVLADLRAAIARVWPFVREARRRFKGVVTLRFFRLTGSFGTGDPAGTAWLLGTVYALAGAKGSADSVRLAGDFQRAIADGRCEVEWKVSTIRLWAAALALAWLNWKHARALRTKKEA
ncbi:MAG TPA: hypothetical protein PK384_02885 [Candidatus Latescibacteria bacterium]|nr:hypothetical protein [Candidatus Latescibacterota bacterium]